MTTDEPAPTSGAGSSRQKGGQMDSRFIRLGSPSVAAQVHVSPDSRYILLPVLEQATAIRGWVIYDSVSGYVLEAEELGSRPADEGVFASMHAARDWVTNHLAPRRAS